jgi:hypothetical protein
MFPFTPQIHRNSVTEFVIRPPEGRIYQVFTSLGEELRRRLYSNLDNAQVVEYALHNQWVIVKLRRISPADATGSSQWYRTIVELNHKSLQHWRVFSNLCSLLQKLEDIIGYPLESEIRVFKSHDGKRQEIARHLTHSSSFARLYLHQFVS